MDINFLEIFQGVNTLVHSDALHIAARIGLIALGALVIWLGKKGTLEPLIMIPMGVGMIAVNAGVMFLDPVTTSYMRDGAQVIDPATGQAIRDQGTLFVAPLVQETNSLVNVLQIDWLQPIYTLTFSNGLIACVVFMGIGTLLDVGYVLQRPFQSMVIALFAELGTFVVFPIAVAMGLTYGQSASIAMVGGADGPMVMFTSLMLAKDLFVPITVVAYLYLGLTYGGYPYLIRAMVPKGVRASKTGKGNGFQPTSGEKLAFAVIACAVLCFLFPVAAPLFMSLFLGVILKEADLPDYFKLVTNTFLYTATFFLGLMLGVLCEAGTILNPVVLKLLVLGMLALLISGIGGLIGGWVLYWLTGKRYNPVIGIAGVSCVPTCAKVAQKEVTKANPAEIILPAALGANISGVITSAVICGVFIAVLGK